jgi:hypothetical protein
MFYFFNVWTQTFVNRMCFRKFHASMTSQLLDDTKSMCKVVCL